MTPIVASDPGLLLAARWILAAVFAVGVAHKLTAPRAFAITLAGYRLLPARLARPAALIVIAAEAMTTLFLVANRPGGGTAAALLLAVYTIALTLNLVRGRRDIDCGCSGPQLRQTLSWRLPVRNVLLLTLAVVAARTAAERQLAALDWLTAGVAALAFASLYFAIERLAAIRARYALRVF